MSRGRAEKRDEGGRLRAAAKGDRRRRTNRGTRWRRGWWRRVCDRRSERPSALLRRERAFQFRCRSRARGRLQSLLAPSGLPHRGSATSSGQPQRKRCRKRRSAMRYGYWLPVFGGWLRNVENENMEVSWAYVKKLAQPSEQIGFDLTLIAELHLNDINGVPAPSLAAWSTTSARPAVTAPRGLTVPVRPTFHLPALLAKRAANIDRISNGRLRLNGLPSWAAAEPRKDRGRLCHHDARY